MSRIVLSVDGNVVYDSGATIVTPPPPPPPVYTDGTGQLQQKADWPAWQPGGSPNTCGAPRLSLSFPTQLAIKFTAAELLAPGQNVGNFSVYESSKLALTIADAPFLQAEPGGVVPAVNALSGKDGIKFAAHDHPATDQQLKDSGYKRLPAGDTLYVNFKPLNNEPLAFTPLYGY